MFKFKLRCIASTLLSCWWTITSIRPAIKYLHHVVNGYWPWNAVFCGYLSSRIMRINKQMLLHFSKIIIIWRWNAVAWNYLIHSLCEFWNVYCIKRKKNKIEVYKNCKMFFVKERVQPNNKHLPRSETT